jgi:hypothetical protein
VGKDADLVLFNGHPFSIYSRPEVTMIEGEVYFDRKQDVANRELLAKEKKELIEKERKLNLPTQPVQGGQVFIPTLSEDDLDGHLHDGKKQAPVITQAFGVPVRRAGSQPAHAPALH